MNKTPGPAVLTVNRQPKAADRIAGLSALRAKIRALELGRAHAHAHAHVSGAPEAPPCLAFGLAALDDWLPDRGLPLACLHEVAAEPAAGEAGDAVGFAAATGFAAALLGRLAAADPRARPVLWCLPAGDERPGRFGVGALYGPGLGALGLAADRLLVVRAAAPADVLWTMEEALRSRAVAAVLGQVGKISLTESRRLQLAAEEGGVTALLLRRPPRRNRGVAGAPSSTTPMTTAVTHWAVGPRRGEGRAEQTGRITAGWRVWLRRCRGGRPGGWELDWDHATHRFTLAAQLRD